jgi:hypothetical protein
VVLDNRGDRGIVGDSNTDFMQGFVVSGTVRTVIVVIVVYGDTCVRSDVVLKIGCNNYSQCQLQALSVIAKY